MIFLFSGLFGEGRHCVILQSGFLYRLKPLPPFVGIAFRTTRNLSVILLAELFVPLKTSPSAKAATSPFRGGLGVDVAAEKVRAKCFETTTKKAIKTKPEGNGKASPERGGGATQVAPERYPPRVGGGSP